MVVVICGATQCEVKELRSEPRKPVEVITRCGNVVHHPWLVFDEVITCRSCLAKRGRTRCRSY